MDWNKSNSLTYEDFKNVMTKERVSKSQIKKNIRKGLESLKEGEDYLILGTGEFNGELWVAYQPLTYIASRTIASNSVEPKQESGAQWCTAYQKSRRFWDKHSIKSKEAFIYLCGESIPTKKVAISPSKNHADYDGSIYKYILGNLNYNIWNFYDNVKGPIIKITDLPQEIEALISISYENYNLVLENHDRDVKISRELERQELFKKLIFNEETQRYDYPNEGKEWFDVSILIKDGKFILPLGVWEGEFDCGDNQLTPLDGCPQIVKWGDFDCSNNNLTSLKGCPEKVIAGSFNCSNNQITSLKDSYLKGVGGDFNCSNNKLTSLEGSPEVVMEDFRCRNNSKQFTEEEVRQYCKTPWRVFV